MMSCPPALAGAAFIIANAAVAPSTVRRDMEALISFLSLGFGFEKPAGLARPTEPHVVANLDTVQRFIEGRRFPGGEHCSRIRLDEPFGQSTEIGHHRDQSVEFFRRILRYTWLNTGELDPFRRQQQDAPVSRPATLT